MPDRQNEPAETDHDAIVEMRARLSVVERETESLREWRHDSVAPVMMEIQASQRRNIEAIGKLSEAQTRTTETVNQLALSIAPLARLPAEIAAHKDDDNRLFSNLSTGLTQTHQVIHAAKDDLTLKMSEHRAEGAKGQRAIILWIAGLLFTAASVVIGAQYALLSPHLQWH